MSRVLGIAEVEHAAAALRQWQLRQTCHQTACDLRVSLGLQGLLGRPNLQGATAGAQSLQVVRPLVRVCPTDNCKAGFGHR